MLLSREQPTSHQKKLTARHHGPANLADLVVAMNEFGSRSVTLRAPTGKSCLNALKWAKDVDAFLSQHSWQLLSQDFLDQHSALGSQQSRAARAK